MTVEQLLQQFSERQGWDENSQLRLLVSFLQTRSPYWPAALPLLTDLRSFLQNVADEENTWSTPPL